MPPVIVMVITACLASGHCRDFQVPLEPEVTLFQCDIHGQFGVAQWKAEHPAFVVRRYRCETGGGRVI